MSSTALAPSLQVAVPEATTLAVGFVLLSGGLLGMSIRNMFESIMADDEEGGDGGDLGGEEMDGGLMTDEGDGDDDLGGLGGLDDSDDLGGFGGDDEFGEMEGGGGGGNVGELEHRLDELENEVGNLSSTVNTVRNENEQISGSVEEVEENVRKLLDIYEMVTRGVNPFADDIDAGMGGGLGDDESFGLFADEDEGGDAEVDDDIADADAEGFFDEDLVEDDAAVDPGVDDAFDEGDAFQDNFDDGDDADEGTDSDGGGTSFEELKDEYESGDADWAEEDLDDGDDQAEGVAEGLDAELSDDLGDSLEGGSEEPFDDDLADDDLFDEVIEADETDDEDAVEPAPEDAEEAVEAEEAADEAAAEEAIEGDASNGAGDLEGAEGKVPAETEQDASVDDDTGVVEEAEAATDQEPSLGGNGPAPDDAQAGDEVAGTDEPGDVGAAPDASNGVATGNAEGKPYLATLPEGFASDLIVVEWLEFLVSEAGVRETASAIDYYESIDWIDERVADQLQEYLAGFESAGSGSLTIDHHTQSLKFISQLNGGAGAELLGARRLRQGGGLDGIQR